MSSPKWYLFLFLSFYLSLSLSLSIYLFISLSLPLSLPLALFILSCCPQDHIYSNTWRTIFRNCISLSTFPLLLVQASHDESFFTSGHLIRSKCYLFMPRPVYRFPLCANTCEKWKRHVLNRSGIGNAGVEIAIFRHAFDRLSLDNHLLLRFSKLFFNI